LSFHVQKGEKELTEERKDKGMKGKGIRKGRRRRG